MGSAKANMDAMEQRQNNRNLWHTTLTNTLQADPPYCIFAIFCSPCASYLLRQRALYGDMSRYTCCAGYLPCSGKCGERKCPEFCLCVEVCLCFGNSVASTRFLLQDEFDIQTTKCDNCIIGFMVCLQQLACIFSIVALLTGIEEVREASQLLSCLSHLVYCTVCACMQTQHKIEMDKRDGKFGAQRVMAVPPMQQMSRMDQGVPPPVGYPGHHAHGQPQPYHGYGAPPPQAAYPPGTNPPGYVPPSAYPPGGHPPPQAAYPPGSHPPGYGAPPPQAAYPPSGNPPGYGAPPPPGTYPPVANPPGHYVPPSLAGHPSPPNPQPSTAPQGGNPESDHSKK